MKTIIKSNSVPTTAGHAAVASRRHLPAIAGRQSQQGLTMISWIIVIVFLLFQAVIALNVIPVYYTDMTVKSIVEELPGDIKAQQSTTSQLKDMILKRMRINNVTLVKPDNVKIKKGGGKFMVTVEYEPRGTLIGNLEYIVLFKHETEIPLQR